MSDIARLNQLRALAVEAKEFEENIHKDEVFDKYDEYDTYPNELFQAAFRPAKAIELIDEIDSLRTQLAEALAEAEALRSLTYCGCGDQFSEHEPGRCAVCVAIKKDAAMGGQKEQG